MNGPGSASLPARDVVLVGAGHTHLHVVRMWRMRPPSDARLTLVSPFSRATYSGMLPGVLAGLYPPDEMEIDLWRLCAAAGARLIVAPATGLDPDGRRVLLADRPPLPFDVASIGIGSIPGQRELWSGRPQILSIKPMATFRERFEAALAGRSHRQAGSHAPSGAPRIAVVGAGAGGTEIVFALDALLRGRGAAAELALLDSGPDILAGYSAGTVRRARAELARRGIAVKTGLRVTGATDVERNDLPHASDRIGAGPEDGAPPPAASPPAPVALHFDRGEPLVADIVIWAASAAPPPVLADFRLPLAADGFLAVRPTLLTTADLPVFAVGDSATIVDRPLPKAGVYAVREGPVLWDNVQRLLAGQTLIPYVPQRGFLSLLSTGDRRAIMEYKGGSAHGRWAWRWKDHIDRKFMRKHRDLPPLPSGAMTAAATAEQSAAAMRCTGCGSKLGSQALASALARLDPSSAAMATSGRDDAALLDRRTTPVDVLSVDFFPAFLDDPYLVGRIAALHALSDVWAMGAEPLGALALATLPAGPASQQSELLYQLLAGGVRELSAAGAALWGGHTTEGLELSIGYSVAGRLDGRPPLTKGGLRPGDRLVLTKPLGTATLLAAHREATCPAPALDALLASMLRSNAPAARRARACGVVAATDVTGFGLAGHLFEMLDAGGVSARLSLAAIPLLESFAELSAAGRRSSLDPANRALESRLIVEDEALRRLPQYHSLFDPQTSGGLLLGAPAAHAARLVEELQSAGHAAALIGEVERAVPASAGPRQVSLHIVA